MQETGIIRKESAECVIKNTLFKENTRLLSESFRTSSTEREELYWKMKNYIYTDLKAHGDKTERFCGVNLRFSQPSSKGFLVGKISIKMFSN